MKTNWISYKDYLSKLEKRNENWLKSSYLDYLKKHEEYQKLPFLQVYSELSEVIPVYYKTTSVDNFYFPIDTEYRKNVTRDILYPTWDVLRYTSLKVDPKTFEKTIQVYQRSIPITTVGRLRGNIEYLEDRWRVQIQPIAFKYVYNNYNTLNFTDSKQMRLRDKYIKIRVRYDGTEYAMINAIKTYYTISYA